jgi:small basic protein (TIGR04137 family)
MSVHKSLAPRNRLSRSRNVLKRHERLAILAAEGRWEKGEDSVYGLPKTKDPVAAKKK